ncbi:NAD(+) diphosphatase [Oceanicola sp. S124]|uniref:NAD(+) diphosphatase n=1 Tax=Oceanicola sp. S124 TaxID=1042378 RepID=UPI000255A6E6|nr:NAD(+) diphosphatase [Oceanicola sp. S124]
MDMIFDAGASGRMTFGDSGLDRLAEARGDTAALQADRDARCLLFWRGLVLAEGGHLARLAMDHPALAAAQEPPVLLGRSATGPVFARDISAWVPPEGAAQPPHHPEFAEGQDLCDLRAVMYGLSPEEGELSAMARALFSWHQTHRFCACCGAPSLPEEAGWQRACPACGARHFPRTDPVVIMLITRGDRVLLGRSPGWPEAMYSLPAGFVEPGETIEAAVRREVREETGVAVGAVDYLSCQPWPFPNSLMFGCRGTALSERITLDPVELEDALWLSREALVQVFAGEHPTIRRPRQGAIAEHLLRNWLADTLD